MDDQINLRFSNEEALVLYDWLYSQDFLNYPVVPDEATLRLLWRIEGVLESKLLVIVLPGYLEELKKAKEKIVLEGALMDQ